MFSGSLTSKGVYHRKASQGTWNYMGIMGLALNVMGVLGGRFLTRQ